MASNAPTTGAPTCAPILADADRHLHLTAAPPRVGRAGEPSPMAATALASNMTPEHCEQIAHIFLKTAHELRIIELRGGRV